MIGAVPTVAKEGSRVDTDGGGAVRRRRTDRCQEHVRPPEKIMNKKALFHAGPVWL
jgi:hypothetical protein